MDLLPLKAFKELMEFRGETCISMYMPTQKAGKEVSQNSIRYKNLLQEVERKLEDRQLGKRDMQDYLQPLKQLMSKETFWRNQGIGLAIFYQQGELLAYRLPIPFEEKVFISDRYYIRPLLPMFVENEKFYLLALDLKDVKLYGGTRYTVDEINLSDKPTSMEEALVYEDPEKRLELHNTSSPSHEGQKGIFHQHHPEEDEEKDIQRFFNQVDTAVMDRIGGESAPLIIIGANNQLPIYKDANSYPHLQGEIERGNPHILDAGELHEMAWEKVSRVVEKEIEKVKNDYHVLLERDQALHEMEDIVPAAIHGQINKLMTAKGETSWGTYNRNANEYQKKTAEEERAREMVGFAAIQTIANNGVVYELEKEEMPDPASKVAAIKRY
jgi:hypothetical protein